MAHRKWVALLCAFLAAGDPAPPCTSAADCEYLGTCLSNGTCACKTGFTGPTCAQLDLAPADPKRAVQWPLGQSFTNETAYGWGFSVVRGDDGWYEGVANVGCYDTKGQVDGTFNVHVRSRDPSGGWEFVRALTPPTSFNPHLVRAPDGRYVLFFRVNDLNNWPACTGVAAGGPPSTIAPYITRDMIAEYLSGSCDGNGVCMFIAVSSAGMSGPWDVKPINITGGGCDDLHKSNPSGLFLQDGRVLIAFRYNLHGEGVSIAVADSVEGPFQAVVRCNYTDGLTTWGEDPFLWQDASDETVHMYYHSYRFQRTGWPSLHAFSKTGDLWNVTQSYTGVGAYSTNVTFSDGSKGVYSRRERPELLFDEQGVPMLFYSAIQEEKAGVGAGDGDEPGFPYSFSLAQPVRR